MRVIQLAAIAASAIAQRTFDGGSYADIPNCLDLLNETQKQSVNTDDWRISYQFTIPGVTKCSYVMQSTGFAYWEGDQTTVRYEVFNQPTDGGTACVAGDTDLSYYKGTTMYTW